MKKMLLNINKTAKFKTTRIQLNFLNEPTKKSFSARAVLLNMLKEQTKRYPTKALLLNHLHERYNMRLSGQPYKIGHVQMLSLTVEFVQSAYTLEDDDMFQDAVEVLKSVVFEPLLTEKLFFQEKRLLVEYFDSIYADKAHYAMISLLKHMYPDPIFHIDGSGDKEDAEALRFEDVLKAYDELFSDQVICTVLGNVDEAKTKQLLQEAFPLSFDEEKKFQYTMLNNKPPKTKEIIETQQIKQTNLVVGYHFPVYYHHSDYLKARFFNVLLGGHSESLLFKEIREKHNLAYYISSSYDPYSGLLLIQTGIDAKQKQKVLQMIDQTVKQLVAQTYSTKQFTQSVKQLKNSMIQSQDSQVRLTNQSTLKALFDIDQSPEKRITELETFTKDDVSSMATSLVLDTIFVLTGVDHA